MIMITVAGVGLAVCMERGIDTSFVDNYINYA